MIRGPGETRQCFYNELAFSPGVFLFSTRSAQRSSSSSQHPDLESCSVLSVSLIYSTSVFMLLVLFIPPALTP